VIAFRPQKMLVAHISCPVYRGSHSSSTYFERRCDDSNTPQFNWYPLGAVSVLRSGPLLSSPPARGALQAAIRSLAEKSWSHPVTGCQVHFATGTIARWYATARRQRDDPLSALRRAVRKDRGKISLAAAIADRLILQYRRYPHWSYQLHYDNLAAVVRADSSLGRLPPIPQSSATCSNC
jgi:hypothetical protein